MTTREPVLHKVTLMLCSLCLDGAGGGCYTPGCALWISQAPDISLRHRPSVLRIDDEKPPGYGDGSSSRDTRPSSASPTTAR